MVNSDRCSKLNRVVEQYLKNTTLCLHLALDVLDVGLKNRDTKARRQKLISVLAVPGFRSGKVTIEGATPVLRKLKTKGGRLTIRDAAVWLQEWGMDHPEILEAARNFAVSNPPIEVIDSESMEKWMQGYPDYESKNPDVKAHSKIALLAVVGEQEHLDESEQAANEKDCNPLFAPFQHILNEMNELPAEDPAWDVFTLFLDEMREIAELKNSHRQAGETRSQLLTTIVEHRISLDDPDRKQCIEYFEISLDLDWLNPLAGSQVNTRTVEVLVGLIHSIDQARAVLETPEPKGLAALGKRVHLLQEHQDRIISLVSQLNALKASSGGEGGVPPTSDPTLTPSNSTTNVVAINISTESPASSTVVDPLIDLPSDETSTLEPGNIEEISSVGDEEFDSDKEGPTSNVAPEEVLDTVKPPLPPMHTDTSRNAVTELNLESRHSNHGPTPVEPVSNDGSLLTEKIRQRVVHLLDHERYGLAYYYMRMVEAEGTIAESTLSPVFGALSLAGHLNAPHSPTFEKISSFYEAYEGIEFRDEAEILAWASILRPALICPESGAYAWLQILLPKNPVYEIFTLITELQTRFPHGVPLGLLKGAQEGMDYESRKLGLRREIEGWRQDLMNHHLVFAHATKVLRQWCKSGFVNEIITAIQNDDSKILLDYERNLQNPTFVDKLIREQEANLDLQRIVGKAEYRLKLLVDEVLERSIRPWLNLENIYRPLDGRQREAAAIFLLKIQEKRLAWENDLRTLSISAGAFTKSSVDCAIKALKQFTTTAHDSESSDTGSTRIEEGLAPLWKDLLLTPLCLSSTYEPENSIRAREDLERFLDAQDFSPESAVKLHINQRDIRRAEMIRVQFAPESDEIKRQVAAAGTDNSTTLRDLLERRMREADLALSNGLLGEEEKNTLELICLRIKGELDVNLPEENDYSGWFRELQCMQSQIDMRKEDRKLEVLNRIKVLDLPPVSEDLARVTRLVERGDYQTATEYVQLLTDHQQISVIEDRDVFAEFYPERCREIHLSRNAPAPFSEPRALENAVREGKSVAGLPFENLDRQKLHQAADTLKSWSHLKGKRDDENHIHLKSIINFLGFKNPFVELESGSTKSNRMIVKLSSEVIAERAICPVEEFGSKAHGRYRLLLIWARPNEDHLNAIVGDTVQHSYPTIVVFFGRLGAEERGRLAIQAKETQRNFLVLDENLLLFLASEKSYRLPSFFRCTLPFTGIDPFVATSSYVPPEVFFGRKQELSSLLDITKGDCFVYGGRQLGKTALLREAKRRFDNPKAGRNALWIDLRSREVGYAYPASHIWPILQNDFAKEIKGLFDAPKKGVKDPADLFIDNVKTWLSQEPERRILLLLDEADHFLEQDGVNAFRECAKLKNLMEETRRRFKVVFAGLHNVQRTTILANNPLVHLGQAINIGPLHGEEFREAERLVREPLEAIGFRFQNPDLVGRILARTNFYPSLIQMYCKRLLKELGVPSRSPQVYNGLPPYLISEKYVDKVQENPEHRKDITGRFQITLDLDLRYGFLANLVAYFTLEGKSLPLRLLFREAMDWWPEGFQKSTESEFSVLLDEMVGLGVLRHDATQGTYLLRNANTLLLLGPKKNIEEAIERFGSIKWDQGFNPAIYRRRWNQVTLKRSPLTFADEGWLVASKQSGVSLITGTVASGLLDLEDAINALDVSVRCVVCPPVEGPSGFKAWLTETHKTVKEGFLFLLVPHDLPWSESWIKEATIKLRQLRKSDRYARIIFSADAEKLWMLMPLWDELVRNTGELGLQNIQLRPWAPAFIRQWAKDCGLPRPDETVNALMVKSNCWAEPLHYLAKALLEGMTVEQIIDPFGIGGSQAEHYLQKLMDSGRFIGNEVWLKEEDAEALASLEPSLTIGSLKQCIRWGEILGLLTPVDGRTWKVDQLIVNYLLPEKNV